MPATEPPTEPPTKPPTEPPTELPTESLIELVTESSITQQVTPYSVYLDNYFTSVALFKFLREKGYGACGTTHSNQAPAVLAELRDYTAAIPWNTLYAIEQEKVLCLAMQDNNMVLALSTIHSLDTFIERIRKRPGELSTNANIVRKVFEGQPQKKLKIPVMIDDYNHNMNGVDLANQYRAAYTSHRITYRTWLPIFYWLIDSAAVNAYRLYYLYKKQQGVPKKDLPYHISFHEKLYQQLFEFAPKIHDNLPIERSNRDLNHQRISLPKRLLLNKISYNIHYRNHSNLHKTYRRGDRTI
ncbi:predicted protein [Histoplasma mississippiense (nom. inval.)]|uniref:predicted protein n=1 Tax=Ajellomyces capsulatus (strain NAm1 / WU24) TaxID=2059318 RepID=UPI000157CB40|nr:predicted protein [Histoplasma mississippiense (nom. inval.)]EDN09802.1 predicted protein [Histoplasma mississippiense (nom. inval.)]